MLTQYNPNGVFIALEELGYLLMSLVFLCVAPVFTEKNRLEQMIRWLFSLSFAAAIVALVIVSAAHGIDRGDDFEIAVISIVWLTLIAGGFFWRSCSGASAEACLTERATRLSLESQSPV